MVYNNETYQYVLLVVSVDKPTSGQVKGQYLRITRCLSTNKKNLHTTNSW